MIEILHGLIDALRRELQQYGEMLARLDQQQQSIVRRSADDVLASVASVQEQGAAILQARSAREEAQRRLAAHYHQARQAQLSDLARHVPADYRPLLEALVVENNQLLARIQKRAGQNHILLRRSLDMMQELLRSLSPAGHLTVYDAGGKSLAQQSRSCALYEAAG